MTPNQYIEEIMRHLVLPNATKKRIRQDLEQDIQSAIDQGETFDQVMRRMGSSEDVARDFNESLAAPAAVLSGKQKAVKILLIVVIVLSALSLLSTGIPLLFSFLFSFHQSLGIIGGADGPTAIFITGTLSPLLVAVRLLLPALFLLASIWGLRCISRAKK